MKPTDQTLKRKKLLSDSFTSRTKLKLRNASCSFVRSCVSKIARLRRRMHPKIFGHAATVSDELLDNNFAEAILGLEHRSSQDKGGI